MKKESKVGKSKVECRMSKVKDCDAGLLIFNFPTFDLQTFDFPTFDSSNHHPAVNL